MKDLIVFTNNETYVEETLKGFKTFTSVNVKTTICYNYDDLKEVNLDESDSEIVFILSPTYFSLSSIFLLSLLAHKYSNRLTVLYKPFEALGKDEVSFTLLQNKEAMNLFKTTPFKTIDIYLGSTSNLFESVYYKLVDEKFSNIVYNVGEFVFNKGSVLALKDWIDKAEKENENSFDTKDLILKALIILNERNNSK